jgi:hypothetical protein
LVTPNSIMSDTRCVGQKIHLSTEAYLVSQGLRTDHHGMDEGINQGGFHGFSYQH